MKTILLSLLFLYVNIFEPQGDLVPIKYKNVDDIILVPVTLNEHKGWMVIDTGAGISVIDKSIGEKVGVYETYSSDITIHGYGGSETNMKYCRNVKLDVGGNYLYSHYLMFDISHVTDMLERRVKGEVFGIIGGDLLSTNRFIIDYNEKSLYILGKEKKFLFVKNK